jgi:hypothetical protein
MFMFKIILSIYLFCIHEFCPIRPRQKYIHVYNALSVIIKKRRIFTITRVILFQNTIIFFWIIQFCAFTSDRILFGLLSSLKHNCEQWFTTGQSDDFSSHLFWLIKINLELKVITMSFYFIIFAFEKLDSLHLLFW